VIDGNDMASMAVFLAVFFSITGLAMWLLLRLDGDRQRELSRLRDLYVPGEDRPSTGVGTLALTALPKAGAILLPGAEGPRAQLQARLNRAGLYNPLALRAFLGAKLLLMAGLPLLAAGVPSALGLLSGQRLLAAAAVAAGVGMLLPDVWLDSRRRARQTNLRRALPDCLDMLVLCLEGGVSLTAAMQRVTEELQTAHPLLAGEMNIVQREIQLGMTAGEAIKKFAERCDLEDVRNLASVLLQSERFGAGVVKALRMHADTCRQERYQRAEEMAQKAAVKILFPTLLCIFPAIFIVILGPAAYQLADMYSKMK
jgi:tight adherence protein C